MLSAALVVRTTSTPPRFASCLSPSALSLLTTPPPAAAVAAAAAARPPQRAPEKPLTRLTQSPTPMKLLLPLLLLFALAAAATWSPEDYEIFSLNDKVRADLGDETTFYSWLGVSSKASVLEISKAYRKVSRQLHPDKVAAGSSAAVRRGAEERFQRLSLVGNILRDQLLRKRYDYFHAKGFPQWRGTGYFYSKFRPGMALTAALVFAIVSALHFVALVIGRRQDIKRIEALQAQIKQQAWGGSGVPPADGSDRRVASDARTFVVAADGLVYLEDGLALHVLDPAAINPTPHWRESLLVAAPVAVWNATVGRWIGRVEPYVYTPPQDAANTAAAAAAAPVAVRKRKARGDKITLPNGRVAYGRKRN